MYYYKISLMQHSKYIDEFFTYKSEKMLHIGEVVLVPFGKNNKFVSGIVISETKNCSNIEKIKSIKKVLTDEYGLRENDVKLALWLRENCMCSYFEALKLFMPPGNYNKKNEVRMLLYSVTDSQKLAELSEKLPKNAKNKFAFYKFLIKTETVTDGILKKNFSFSYRQYIKALSERGILSISLVEPSINSDSAETRLSFKLNEPQQGVFDSLKSIYLHEENKKTLIHGVTGSGKTEIYIAFINYVLKNGKTAIVLVPEISLTPQTIERFRKVFGEKIAVLHSRLTARERYDQWVRIKKGTGRIVIGARSALFAPVSDLGCIIVDECHDEAYISEMSPKYDAVQTAGAICKMNKALLILGSATPSVKQYYYSKTGRLKLLELKERANGRQLPSVETVDMIKELKSGNRSLISRKLQSEINAALKMGGRALIFLNRRGYSNYLTCDSCGYVPTCENCDITLTYHKSDDSFRCHYCGYKIKSYRACPECDDGTLTDMGSGTQKIETQASKLFPKANLFRLDADTCAKKGMQETILNEFRNTDSSILIGTQMIGKGHDFPNLMTVGVINADQGLNSPDFKASERTFNLIEQVGGRAGRDGSWGKVIIQTYQSINPLIYFIKNHDYQGFYEYEIKNRQRFEYEPFGNLITLTVSSGTEKDAYISGKKLMDALNFYNTHNLDSGLKIYNLTSCLVHKLENKYRYQIIIKVSNDMLKRAKAMIQYTLTKKRAVVLLAGVSAAAFVNQPNMI